MRSRELERIRANLLEQRAEILKMYHSEIEEGRREEDTVEDPIDQATASYQRDLNIVFSAVDYERLAAIENAVAALDAGRYGDCADCGKKIAKVRLAAVPWTQHCVECQERQEAQVVD